jgi:hypothetical protein
MMENSFLPWKYVFYGYLFIEYALSVLQDIFRLFLIYNMPNM